MPVGSEIKAPSLFIYGAEDAKDNVPIEESVGPIERLRIDARSGDGMLHVYPGMGHGLMDQEIGWDWRPLLIVNAITASRGRR